VRVIAPVELKQEMADYGRWLLSANSKSKDKEEFLRNKG
jgi:hypothetical protein